MTKGLGLTTAESLGLGRVMCLMSGVVLTVYARGNSQGQRRVKWLRGAWGGLGWVGAGRSETSPPNQTHGKLSPCQGIMESQTPSR